MPDTSDPLERLSVPPAAGDPQAPPPKVLTDAARRALQEAQDRRAAREAEPTAAPPEQGGPSGPDPTRYGDWERKGLAIDF